MAGKKISKNALRKALFQKYSIVMECFSTLPEGAGMGPREQAYVDFAAQAWYQALLLRFIDLRGHALNSCGRKAQELGHVTRRASNNAWIARVMAQEK